MEVVRHFRVAQGRASERGKTAAVQPSNNAAFPNANSSILGDNYQLCEMEISDEESTAKVEKCVPAESFTKSSDIQLASNLHGSSSSTDDEFDVYSLLERDVDEANELELRNAALLSMQSKVAAELSAALDGRGALDQDNPQLHPHSESDSDSDSESQSRREDREEGECSDDEQSAKVARQLAELDTLILSQRVLNPHKQKRIATHRPSRSRQSSSSSSISLSESSRNVANLKQSLTGRGQLGSTVHPSSSDALPSRRQLRTRTTGSRDVRWARVPREASSRTRKRLDAFEQMRVRKEAQERIALRDKRLAELEGGAVTTLVPQFGSSPTAQIAAPVSMDEQSGLLPSLVLSPVCVAGESATATADVPKPEYVQPPFPAIIPDVCGNPNLAISNTVPWSGVPLNLPASHLGVPPFSNSVPSFLIDSVVQPARPPPPPLHAAAPRKEVSVPSRLSELDTCQPMQMQQRILRRDRKFSSSTSPTQKAAKYAAAARLASVSTGTGAARLSGGAKKLFHADTVSVLKTRFSVVRTNPVGPRSSFSSLGRPALSSRTNVYRPHASHLANTLQTKIDDKRFVVNLETSSEDEETPAEAKKPKLKDSSELLLRKTRSNSKQQKESTAASEVSMAASATEPFGAEIENAASKHSEMQRDYLEAKQRLAIEQKEHEKLKGLIKAHRDLQAQTHSRIEKCERKLAKLRATEQQQSSILESLLRRSTTLAHGMRQRSKQMLEADSKMREAKQRQVQCILKQQSCVKQTDEVKRLRVTLTCKRRDLLLLRDSVNERLGQLSSSSMQSPSPSPSAPSAQSVLDVACRLLTCTLHRLFPPLRSCHQESACSVQHAEANKTSALRLQELSTPVCPFELSRRNGCSDDACNLRHVSKKPTNVIEVAPRFALDDIELDWRRAVARFWKPNKSLQKSPYSCPLCGAFDLANTAAADRHFKEESCQTCLHSLQQVVASRCDALAIRSLMMITHHLIVRLRLPQINNNRGSPRKSSSEAVPMAQLNILVDAFCTALPAFSTCREAACVALKHVMYVFALCCETEQVSSLSDSLDRLLLVVFLDNNLRVDMEEIVCYLLWQSVHKVPVRLHLIEALLRTLLSDNRCSSSNSDLMMELLLTYLYVAVHFGASTARNARQFLLDLYDQLERALVGQLAVLFLLRIGLTLNVLPVLDHAVQFTSRSVGNARSFALRFDLDVLRSNGLLIDWSAVDTVLLTERKSEIEQLFTSTINKLATSETHTLYTNWYNYLISTNQASELRCWCEKVCNNRKLPRTVRLDALLHFLYDALIRQEADVTDSVLFSWIRAASRGQLHSLDESYAANDADGPVDVTIASCLFYVVVMQLLRVEHSQLNTPSTSFCNESVHKLLHFYFSECLSNSQRRQLRSSFQSFGQFESIETNDSFRSLMAFLPCNATSECPHVLPAGDADVFAHLLLAVWLACKQQSDRDCHLIHQFVRFMHDNSFVDVESRHQVAAFSVEFSILMREEMQVGNTLQAAVNRELSTSLFGSASREQRCAELLSIFARPDCVADWQLVVDSAKDARGLQFTFLLCRSVAVRARIAHVLASRYRIAQTSPAFCRVAEWPNVLPQVVTTCSWSAIGWCTLFQCIVEQLNAYDSATELAQVRSHKVADLKVLLKRFHAVLSAFKQWIKRFDEIGYSAEGVRARLL